MKMRLSPASYIVFLVMLFVFSADMTASVLPHTLFSPYYRSRRYLAIAVGRGEGG